MGVEVVVRCGRRWSVIWDFWGEFLGLGEEERGGFVCCFGEVFFGERWEVGASFWPLAHTVS